MNTIRPSVKAINAINAAKAINAIKKINAFRPRGDCICPISWGCLCAQP
jgi:hypothetical protein